MNRSSSPNSGHWADQPERGNLRLMRLLAWAARKLGRRAVAPIVRMVVLYFYLFGGQARRSIAQYQHRLTATAPGRRLFPVRRAVYRQFLAFAEALLDKLDCWQEKMQASDLDIVDASRLHEQMGQGRGQILVSSHLGNMEVCRALVNQESRLMLNVLVHDKHAQQFNHLLHEAGASKLRLLQVSELDMATMLQLGERIEQGEWLAIAGDRIPLHGSRTVDVNFLGAAAALPQGPWLLAGLLRCPVNLIFCTKQGDRFRVTLERLADNVAWTRATRNAQIQSCAQAYADRLAAHCRDAPLQWFNFYPFWRRHA